MLRLRIGTGITISPGMEITSSVAGAIPAGTTVVSYDGQREVVMSANALSSGEGAVEFGGLAPELNLRMLFDDVYIDRTLARVELGNAPTYNACSRRDLQPPLSWADERISVSLNGPGYSSSDDLYLYVISADGRVSAGYGPFRLQQSGSTPSGSSLWLLLNGTLLEKEGS